MEKKTTDVTDDFVADLWKNHEPCTWSTMLTLFMILCMISSGGCKSCTKFGHVWSLPDDWSPPWDHTEAYDTLPILLICHVFFF